MWVHSFALRHPNSDYRVIISRRIDRCFSGKSWHIHDTYLLSFSSLTIIVRRQFGDQERKLLGHIAANRKLLSKIGVAVGIGDDDIDQLAGGSIAKEAHPPRSAKVSCKFFRRLGVDPGIEHG